MLFLCLKYSKGKKLSLACMISCNICLLQTQRNHGMVVNVVILVVKELYFEPGIKLWYFQTIQLVISDTVLQLGPGLESQQEILDKARFWGDRKSEVNSLIKRALTLIVFLAELWMRRRILTVVVQPLDSCFEAAGLVNCSLKLEGLVDPFVVKSDPP